jgi:hypothetical protein
MDFKWLKFLLDIWFYDLDFKTLKFLSKVVFLLKINNFAPYWNSAPWNLKAPCMKRKSLMINGPQELKHFHPTVAFLEILLMGNWPINQSFMFIFDSNFTSANGILKLSWIFSIGLEYDSGVYPNWLVTGRHLKSLIYWALPGFISTSVKLGTEVTLAFKGMEKAIKW